MKQSLLFTKTIKETPKDETSYNAQVLTRAGFIDKVAPGVYTFLPLGLKVLSKIEQIVREEMDIIGGQELSMPALIPQNLWEKTGRWTSLDILFRLQGTNERGYGLGATHEEIVTPLLQKYVFSYKDLPQAVYQIQTKFRNELRVQGGLLRDREFPMKDLYSFHMGEKDLDSFYEKAREAYVKIFNRCGIGDKTYYTFASGSTFSKYSHEFQTVAEVGEDEIYICSKCKLAINKEIIGERNICMGCGGKDFEIKHAIEVGNIFKLNTKYSDAFNFKYVDQKGSEQPVFMGCYGLGLSRLMGAIVEINHDDKGIVWPAAVAPFKVHLLVLAKDKNDVFSAAQKLYSELLNQNIEVLFDDRLDASAGEKFSDADLIGCPIRLIVSEKTLAADSVEVKKRSEDKQELVKISHLYNYLKK